MTALIAKRTSNNDTTSSTFEEVRSLLSNSRANASRELVLPINMDIAKIISEDSEETDEEEDEEDAPEPLPEVSENLITPSSVNIQSQTRKIREYENLRIMIIFIIKLPRRESDMFFFYVITAPRSFSFVSSFLVR